MKMHTIKLTSEELITFLDAVADANDALRDSIETMENDSYFNPEEDQEELDDLRDKLARNEDLYGKVGDRSI